MKDKSFSVKGFVELSLFCAIIIVLGMTPLGYIPTPAFNIVTVHVPVIIGSLFLGWKKGAFLGFIFGLTSLIMKHIRPDAMAMFFSPFISGNLLSLVVCFLPRILVGIVPYFIFKIFKKSSKNIKKLGLFLAGALGSLTNTFFVMLFIYLFFGKEYAQLLGKSFDKILLVMITSVSFNALIEATISALFTFSIYTSIIKFKK